MEDFSTLVRHFTGSPADQARRATTYLRAAAPGSFLVNTQLALGAIGLAIVIAVLSGVLPSLGLRPRFPPGQRSREGWRG